MLEKLTCALRAIMRPGPSWRGRYLECLAAAAARRNEWDHASEYLRAALRAEPQRLVLHQHLGDVRAKAGDLAEALSSYRNALRLAPGDPAILAPLAFLCFLRGDAAQAEAFAARALGADPAQSVALRVLGHTLRQRGDFDRALPYLRRGAESAGNDPNAWSELGDALRDAGLLADAADSYERALALNPASADVNVMLGDALLALERVDEARSRYEDALRIAPDMPGALSRLAVVTMKAGDSAEAERLLHRARDIAPGELEPLINLGVLSQEHRGNAEEALDYYRRAKAIDPICPEAHVYSAFAHLQLGRFAQGWSEYEWRLRMPAYRFLHQVGRPLWTGREDLSGRTVVVQHEGNVRDTIQFLRYVPLLADRGARVVLEITPALSRLVGRMRGIETVAATRDAMMRAAAKADWRCPLLSIPHRVGADSLGSAIPYLTEDPGGTARWSARLEATSRARKVGVCWSPDPRPHSRESVPGSELRSLTLVPNVTLVKLDTRQAAGDADDFADVDWTSELKDLADVADLIAALDLVITTDGPIAHLAAAIGKRVWILLPHVADWRWMIGDSTAWYPSARLFRQRTPGDWAGVISDAATALAARDAQPDQ